MASNFSTTTRISQPGSPQNCYIPAYASANNRITENCTWSPDAQQQYCAWSTTLESFRSSVLSQTYWLCQTTLVPIGIIGNILLYLTLRISNMPGTTFSFLRLIALFLIGQAVFSIGSTSNGYLFQSLYLSGQMSLFMSNLLGLRVMLALMRFCKMNVCILSAALTFDRYLAIAHPTKYHKISENTIYWTSLISSLVISSLELMWLAEVSTVQTGQDVQLNWMGQQRIYLNDVIFVIVIIKALVIIALIAFSVIIVQKLKQRSVQIGNLTTNDAAVKEYQHMLYLARFQLIDMGMMIFDVGAATSIVHVVISIKRSFTDTYSCSFFYLYYGYRPMVVADIVVRAIGDCVLAYAHGGLFIGYIIFLKKFRVCFKELCRRILRKNPVVISNAVIVSAW